MERETPKVEMGTMSFVGIAGVVLLVLIAIVLCAGAWAGKRLQDATWMIVFAPMRPRIALAVVFVTSFVVSLVTIAVIAMI